MKKLVTKGFQGHVYDNFFDEPKKVRRAALNLGFTAPNPRGVGGFAWRCDVPVMSEIVEKLEAIWGFAINPLRAEIRYTLESAEEISARRGIICHSDAGVSDYTAVIYLSRPQDCKGGTAFFEHKPTKSRSFVAGKSMVDFKSIGDWAEYYCADMKFNRIATYNSAIYHGIKRPFFGEDINSARMIQSIRFNRA